MELEEAIKILKYQLANRNTDVYTPINYEAMELVLNHLKQKEHELNYQKNYCTMVTEQKDDIIKSMAERMSKQEKMIEFMAEALEYNGEGEKEEIIQVVREHVENKVEESE